MGVTGTHSRHFKDLTVEPVPIQTQNGHQCITGNNVTEYRDICLIIGT